MKVFVPILVIMASSSAKRYDLNDDVDNMLSRCNRAKMNHRFLKIRTGEIDTPGSPTVNYAQGGLLGLDSVSRTGDCSVDVDGSKKTFNVQFGLKLMVLALPRVSIGGVLMSAFFRVGDNSLNFTYTVHNESNCHLTIDVLQVERFQNILFGASKTDFEGVDVNNVFQTGIRAWLNKWLDSVRPELEERLQFRCSIPMVKEQLPPTEMADAFTSLMEDIAIF